MTNFVFFFRASDAFDRSFDVQPPFNGVNTTVAMTLLPLNCVPPEILPVTFTVAVATGVSVSFAAVDVFLLFHVIELDAVDGFLEFTSVVQLPAVVGFERKVNFPLVMPLVPVQPDTEPVAFTVDLTFFVLESFGAGGVHTAVPVSFAHVKPVVAEPAGADTYAATGSNDATIRPIPKNLRMEPPPASGHRRNRKCAARHYPPVVGDKPCFPPGAQRRAWAAASVIGLALGATHKTTNLKSFNGQITTTGTFGAAKPVRLEKADSFAVSSDRHSLTFLFKNHGYIDGVDFRTRCAPSIKFAFQSDGKTTPTSRIVIGRHSVHPKHNPFTINRKTGAVSSSPSGRTMKFRGSAPAGPLFGYRAACSMTGPRNAIVASAPESV